MPSVGFFKSYKWASKINTSLFPPTITHSNWRACLKSKLCFSTSSLLTAPNPTLTQPTSPLNRDPLFSKSNFINLMGASPNLKPPYMLLLSCISWPSIPYSFQSCFAQQTLGIPNHVVWATTSWYTKLHAPIVVPGALHIPNHVPTVDQSTLTFHKRTPLYLIWLNLTTL